jgi:ssRNA-specific RNase YbeY (16S rRNA maturation enzyme)
MIKQMVIEIKKEIERDVSHVVYLHVLGQDHVREKEKENFRDLVPVLEVHPPQEET